jgi:NAD(P) transhydrogenase subunit beta
MGLAVLATVIGPGAGLWQLTAILIAIGGLIGYQLASKVEMTQMPELVAGMHALVGLAAVFVGFNAHFELANVLTMDDTQRKRLKGLPHCWQRNLVPRLIFCVLRHHLASGLAPLPLPAR